jgi:hypothetical protein
LFSRVRLLSSHICSIRRPQIVAGQECRFKLNRAAEIYGNKVVAGCPALGRQSARNHNPVTCNGTWHYFRIVTLLRSDSVPTCTLFLRLGYSSVTMKIVNFERGDPAEFSDLYVHLLKAALDEMHPSLSPEVREQNLAAHVAWGISISGLDSGTAPCGIYRPH